MSSMCSKEILVNETLIQRSLKDIFQLKPTVSQYNEMWEVNTVLRVS